MTETLSPETFDFNDWFTDANLPEASADIFTNAGVLGELAELQRRITTETQVVEAEPTAGSKKSTLEDEYVALAEKFTASKITVYMRALTLSERKAVRKAHDAALKAKQEGDEGYLIRCIAASVVGMKRPGQARVTAKLTVGQVKDLHKRIGEAQTTILFQAFQQATNTVPTVDADFLAKSSGPTAGPVS